MVYGIYRPWMRRPNTTIINHNTYMNMPNGCGYGTGGCGGGISNKAWDWIFGLTVGTGLVGGILGGVFQNRQARRDEQAQQALLQQQATEQAEALKKQEAKENIKNTAQQLKQAYGDKYNVMYDDNGIFLVDKKDPSKSYYGKTLEEFINQMGEEESTPPDKTENDQYITQEELNKAVTDAVAEILKETPSEPTQPQNNTSLPEGWKKPELPKGYTWGEMGATDDKYKGKTAEDIARDVLGENAPEAEVTAMAEKIKNMNPNAFGPNDTVTDTSKLNVPVKAGTATGTSTGTGTETTENSTASNWKLMESPGMFSRDAWITAGDGNTYKLRCSNGDHLNHGKLTIEGDKIVLNEAYRNKDWANHPIKLVDRETENSVEFKLEATTGRFVLNGSNSAVYLEDYLNNPEEYTNTEEKTSNTQGEVAGTTSGSETGNSNVITGTVTYGKDKSNRRIASVTVTNSNGVSKTFTTFASDNRMVNIGKLNSLISKDPDFVGQRINLED